MVEIRNRRDVERAVAVRVRMLRCARESVARGERLAADAALLPGYAQQADAVGAVLAAVPRAAIRILRSQNDHCAVVVSANIGWRSAGVVVQVRSAFIPANDTIFQRH